MKKALSRVERFDLAARARTSVLLISRVRVILIFVSILFIWAATSRTAPVRAETLFDRVLPAVIVVVTVILWLEWRLKLYALAVFVFIFALVPVLSHESRSPHTVEDWIATCISLAFCVYWGCRVWIIAGRYAVANSSGWQKEREQLGEWLRILESPGRADVIGFDAGDFSTGYWTYRIFNPGDCWVIAQFKRGTRKFARCLVCQSNEVTFTALPSGKWKIDIMGREKKSFTEIEISPQLPPAFETVPRS